MITQAQIRILLKAILQSLPFSPPYNDDWLNRAFSESGYAPYQALVELLMVLGNEQHPVLPIEAISNALSPQEHPDFQTLYRVISDTVVFNMAASKEGGQPLIERVDRSKFDSYYNQLSGVVDGDYTSRITQADPDDALNTLKLSAIESLGLIYDSFPAKDQLGLPKKLALVSDKVLKKIISDLQKFEKSGEITRGQKKCLDFFTLIYQIRHITPMLIPREEGVILHFCQVPLNIAGVTEKVALISSESVRSSLKSLNKMIPKEISSVEPSVTLDGTMKDPWYLYVLNRKALKLKIEAMIKLPKPHPIRMFGAKKTEVQREHIALNIARLLYPHVTQSSMLIHNDKPCLFIPFDAMRELKEVACGRVNHKYYVGGEYYVDSTFNAVGEGMLGVSTAFIEDFGDRFGYFFLTSDPDAIGGYNQNKGLLDEQYLYIFDQVIMLSDYFHLDTALTLSPRNPTSRHYEGRNRSLIEDCSFDKKFDSVFLVLDKAEQIITMIQSLIDTHHRKCHALRQLREQHSLSPKETVLLDEELPLLIGDALEIQNKIKERIDYMRKQISLPGVSKPLLRQVLLIQKLLNQPVLYNQLGRPYRFPFTGAHSIKVRSVHQFDDGRIVLNLSSKLPVAIEKLLHQRVSKTGGELHIESNRLSLTVDTLPLLKETLFYPECEVWLDLDESYLNMEELKCLSKLYPMPLVWPWLQTKIQLYHDKYPTLELDKKIQILEELIQIIDDCLFDKKAVIKQSEPAFLLHLKRKILFDRQQKIIELCQICLPDVSGTEIGKNIMNAFEASIKLDRMQSFQAVCLMALKKDRLKDPRFGRYLEECVKHGQNACNYKSACDQSRYFTFLNEAVIEALQAPSPVKILSQPGRAVSRAEETTSINLDTLGIDADVLAIQQKESEEAMRMMTQKTKEKTRPLIASQGKRI